MMAVVTEEKEGRNSGFSKRCCRKMYLQFFLVFFFATPRVSWDLTALSSESEDGVLTTGLPRNSCI